jgi:hypothetical protein
MFGGGGSPPRCAQPFETMARTPAFSIAVKIVRVTAAASSTCTEPNPT